MDLGSAVLSAELALELRLSDVPVRLAPAPFVEGLLAAVVSAAAGGDLDTVAAEASAALGAKTGQLGAEEPVPEPVAPSRPAGDAQTRRVLVRNPQGLHARPAAEFVKLANTFPVKVTVNGKDAKSLLGVMSLGLTAGATASIASPDDEGEAAVDALVDLVESGFGEV
jgi:PTS hybrid protein